MKNTIKQTFGVIAIVIMALSLFSCGKEGTDSGNKIKVQTIKLSDQSLGMIVGETKTIIATITPSNANDKSLTWESSNSNIAVVDKNGKVEALKVGTCSIFAKANDGSDIKAECVVTISEKIISVTEVQLNETALELVVGEFSGPLIATVLPDNATNKEVEWSSENVKIATVEGGVVTAIAPGETIVNVKTVDGNKTAKCSIIVKPADILIDHIELTPSIVSLNIGETQQLTITFYPKDPAPTNTNVTWSSSNEKVAAVSETGLITALASGETVISVITQEGNHKAEAKVTVNKPVLFKDVPEEFSTGENALPAWRVADRNFYWESSMSMNMSFVENNTSTTISSYIQGMMTGRYFSQQTVYIENSEYHLPNRAELNGIFPNCINFKEAVNKLNEPEEIQIGMEGDCINYFADYKNQPNEDVNNAVFYAVKMIPTDANGDYSKVCAFRYQWKNYNTHTSVLEIQVKYLGEKVSIDDVATESFWNKSNITINFPACGYYESIPTNSLDPIVAFYDETKTLKEGVGCFYFTRDGENFDPWTGFSDMWSMNIDSEKGLYEKVPSTRAHTLRLFK